MAVMMKALVIEEYGNLNSLHLKEVPIPTPRANQVLIRVEYAPLNPADLEFINGTHNHKRPLPAIPGFEGSGTAIKSGGGFTAWNMVNKKVSFKQEDPGLDGSWAEYIVVDVKLVTIVKGGVPLEQAACFYVNALTVMMFADVIESRKHKAIMQNAAACSIGKMLLRWCNYHDIKVINIVRRDEQATQLKELAADIVLNSESENFETELRILSQRYEVSAAFDCIGGSLSGLMLESLCDYGVLYVHGKISKQPISGISPSSFIFKGKKIEGLWVRPWFHGLSRMKRLSVMQKIQNLDFIFRTDIVGIYNIEQFKEAIELFPSTRSSGKLLFKINSDEPVPKAHIPLQETSLWKFTELSPENAEALIEKYKTPEFKQAAEQLGWLDLRPIDQEGLVYRSSRLLDDGRIYDGQWDKDIMPHGTGVMYYPDGSRFEGLWNEGKKQKGRLITQNGEIFNGDWINNCLEGSGSLLTPDIKYEGEWEQGQFHGIGTLNYANESKYTGSFREGKRHGKGHWTSNTGEEYQGMFENDEMNGEGIYTCKSYKYKGIFEHGIMKGQGTIIFNDGRVFNGELSDELEGEGILMYTNQDEYQGTISKGEPEGKGLFKGINGTVKRGTWSHGQLVSEIIDEEEDKNEGTEVYIQDEVEPQILTIHKPPQTQKEPNKQSQVHTESQHKVEVVHPQPEDSVEVVHKAQYHPVEVEPEHQIEVVHDEPERHVEIVYQKPVQTQSKPQNQLIIPEEEQPVQVLYSPSEPEESKYPVESKHQLESEESKYPVESEESKYPVESEESKNPVESEESKYPVESEESKHPVEPIQQEEQKKPSPRTSKRNAKSKKAPKNQAQAKKSSPASEESKSSIGVDPSSKLE